MLLPSSAMKIEAAAPFETLKSVYHTITHHNKKEYNID
jgi:hypothetical protein